jgi:disease resistance protein RPM1
MYQKGSIIRRKHLTRRWIAEGFVGERPGKSVEEVADDYFEQLIMRKVIQPLEESNNGKVKNCQVHELVHDFIVYKASEENLVTVVGSGYLVPPPSGKVRRLSYSVPESDDGVGADTTAGGVEENIPWRHIIKTRNRDETLASVGNMSHVRSLAVFWGFNTKNRALPSGLLDSPIVQVLDLEGCNDPLLETRHMKMIYKMLLLKYLSLRGTCIKELKEDIGNLKNLETLDVRETDVLLLPDTIWNLQQLVSILGGNKKTGKALKLKIPVAAAKNSKDVGDTDTVELHDTTWNLQQLVCILGRDKKTSKALKLRIMMKALRVLSGIEITKELAQHLEHLPNLRKLAIYKVDKDTNSGKSMLEFLGHRCLRTLVIMADDGSLSGFFSNNPAPSLKLLAALELFGKLKKLPTWIKGLVDLRKLTLPITVFSSDPQLLAKLQELENLFSLTFSGNGLHLPRGKEIIVPTGGFKKLKLLHFCAPLLPPVSFLDDAMPTLERIHLCFTKFDGLHGIHNLLMLQEVHLKVHAHANKFTMSIVNNLTDAMRKDANGPRIICDRYVNITADLS